jgi:hypothetical protein
MAGDIFIRKNTTLAHFKCLRQVRTDLWRIMADATNSFLSLCAHQPRMLQPFQDCDAKQNQFLPFVAALCSAVSDDGFLNVERSTFMSIDGCRRRSLGRLRHCGSARGTLPRPYGGRWRGK